VGWGFGNDFDPAPNEAPPGAFDPEPLPGVPGVPPVVPQPYEYGGDGSDASPNQGFGDDTPSLTPGDPDAGFGDEADKAPPIVLDMDGKGLVFSDEGGDIVTIAGTLPINLAKAGTNFKFVRYKFRVAHVGTGELFPKVGFCYAAIQGNIDVCPVVQLGLVQFALPPCYVGDYHIHVYTCYVPDTANAQYAVTLPYAINVDRRVRDFPTYRVRKSLPPNYLTGPIRVDDEGLYPAEA